MEKCVILSMGLRGTRRNRPENRSPQTIAPCGLQAVLVGSWFPLLLGISGKTPGTPAPSCVTDASCALGGVLRLVSPKAKALDPGLEPQELVRRTRSPTRWQGGTQGAGSGSRDLCRSLSQWIPVTHEGNSSFSLCLFEEDWVQVVTYTARWKHCVLLCTAQGKANNSSILE